MFSLMGFHVFPLRVSCFPSWGFMFSLSRHLSKIPHAAFDIKSKWPETSKRCLVLDNYQLPEQAGNALNGLYMEHSLRAMRLQDRALESWVGRQTRCAMCRQYTNMFIPHGGSKVCHFLCFSSAPLQVDLMASKDNQASHRPMGVPPRQQKV